MPAEDRRAQWAFGAALTLVLSAIALRTGGGLGIADTTVVEMILQIAGGIAAAVAVLAAGGRRAHGAATVAAFGALALLTLISITWAIEPSEAWIETSRTVAWLAMFVIGAVLARLFPRWLEPLLFALLAVALIVSAYALLTKVSPASLDPDEIYARLRAPYDYWNSVGLTAALGLPCCLWLVARRPTHDAIAAIAYPATALMVTAILLSYSRGALLAAAFGLALWFALTDHRLRGVVVLLTGSLAAVLVSLYAFGRDALTTERVRLDLRTDAGHEFGIALFAMLVLVLLAGLAIEFSIARRKPTELAYRRAGLAVIVALALVPLVGLGALATSDRGLFGSISHSWSTLTDPNAITPSNEPGRLTEIGSVRSRYWNEALQIFSDHPFKGVGAGGYLEARPRYRKDSYTVRHAHSYLVQTASDLGVVGLLVSLVLLVTFCAAAARTLGYRLPGVRQEVVAPAVPERIGLIALASIVMTFGVHSLIDWTWFVPGNVLVALICAGWLAGRGDGPAQDTNVGRIVARVREGAREPLRAAAATGVLVLAIAVAWATWQPWRSAQASDAALAALERVPDDPDQLVVAQRHARDAQHRNPLSVEPLFELAAVETAAGHPGRAELLYQRAIRLQPSNPDTWLYYASFALDSRDDPERALALVRPVLYLDPHSADAPALLQRIAQRTGTLYVPPPATPGQAAPAPGG